MFYRKESDQYIHENTPFVIDGVQYPQNWLNHSTLEDKVALGLEPVVVSGLPKNSAYYWNQQVLNGAKLQYEYTPKDVKELQESNTLVIKSRCSAELSASDWRIVKSIETGVAAAPEWIEWRASIRSTAADAIARIEATQSVEELEAVMTSVVWPTAPTV